MTALKVIRALLGVAMYSFVGYLLFSAFRESWRVGSIISGIFILCFGLTYPIEFAAKKLWRMCHG